MADPHGDPTAPRAPGWAGGLRPPLGVLWCCTVPVAGAGGAGAKPVDKALIWGTGFRFWDSGFTLTSGNS
jgi:hypothetical protein